MSFCPFLICASATQTIWDRVRIRCCPSLVSMVGHLLRMERWINERGDFNERDVASAVQAAAPAALRLATTEKPLFKMCLVPPPPPSLLVLFNSVLAPNFVGNCMSLRIFAILFAVTQGDGYAAANWWRLILSRIRSVHLQQRQKRSCRCREIIGVVLYSFR